MILEIIYLNVQFLGSTEWSRKTYPCFKSQWQCCFSFQHTYLGVHLCSDLDAIRPNERLEN